MHAGKDGGIIYNSGRLCVSGVWRNAFIVALLQSFERVNNAAMHCFALIFEINQPQAGADMLRILKFTSCC